MYKLNNKADTCGTGFMGYCDFNVTYSDLVKLFGKPCEGDGYKIDALWIIEFDDGNIATIYNYKTGKNYLGKEGTAKTKLIGSDWHIGGNSMIAVTLINSIIQAYKAVISCKQ